jgi:hypothetical protein
VRGLLHAGFRFSKRLRENQMELTQVFIGVAGRTCLSLDRKTEKVLVLPKQPREE